MFHVGQKVVAVNPGPEVAARCNSTSGNVRLGKIYTIREIDTRYIAYFGFAGIRVVGEIGNTKYVPGHGVMESAYPAPLFRPLAEKKADMEARNELFRKWETHKEKRVTAPQDEQA